MTLVPLLTRRYRYKRLNGEVAMIRISGDTKVSRPKIGHDYGDKKGTGAYPLCACGCGVQTNAGSAVIATGAENLWCAYTACAEKIKAKLGPAELRRRHLPI